VQRWGRGERPVSARCSALIIVLARTRHNDRLAALERHFRTMAEALSDEVRHALCAPDGPRGVSRAAVAGLRKPWRCRPGPPR